MDKTSTLLKNGLMVKETFPADYDRPVEGELIGISGDKGIVLMNGSFKYVRMGNLHVSSS